MQARPRSVFLALLAGSTLLLTATASLAGPPPGRVAPLGVVGAWEPPFDGEVPAINLVLMDDGRVLYWSGIEARERDWVFFLDAPVWAESRVLDLSGGSPAVSSPPHVLGVGHDLFCTGNTHLLDGRVFVAGGTDWSRLPGTQLLFGTRDTQWFSSGLGDWEKGPDMSVGRWYPSVITLRNGDALIASGIANLTDPTTHATAIERFDARENSLSKVGDRLLPLYPRLTLVPSGPLKGKVFYSTVGTLWGTFGEHPLEALWSVQQAFDPASGEGTLLRPSVFGVRQHGASVLLPLDPADGYRARILTTGGTLQRSVLATPLSEMADLSTDPPSNAPAAPMIHPRWHLNAVLLPTGELLAVGGGGIDNVVVHGQPNQPVLPAEIYDPAKGAWTEVAGMTVARMYHSTAILLPDARVLVGGHVPLPVPWSAVRAHVPTQEQVVEKRFEIYDPPYLFRGPRPVVESAPASVGHGQAFEVGVDDASAVSSLVLVRPGATTHAYDAEQRVVKLAFEATGKRTLRAVAPPDGDVAAPGPWMLFAISGSGGAAVPSVAKFVRLG